MYVQTHNWRWLKSDWECPVDSWLIPSSLYIYAIVLTIASIKQKREAINYGTSQFLNCFVIILILKKYVIITSHSITSLFLWNVINFFKYHFISVLVFFILSISIAKKDSALYAAFHVFTKNVYFIAIYNIYFWSNVKLLERNQKYTNN